jgi:tetratricopeptide (TPR) repeat protein
MTDESEAQLRRAEAALELRRPDEARRQLAPVIAADPEDGWALALLAEASRQLEDDDGARALMHRAARSAPDDEAVLFLCGSVAQDLGDLELSRAWIERGLALDPSSTYGRNLLALTLLGVGDLDRARNHVTAALVADPGDPMLLASLGVTAEAQGRSASGMVPWVRALRIAPDLPPLLANVALVRLEAGDLRRGSRLLSAAITLDPRWSAARPLVEAAGMWSRRELEGRFAMVILGAMVAAAVSYVAGAVALVIGVAWLTRCYRRLPRPVQQAALRNLHVFDAVIVVLVAVGLVVPIVLALTIVAWQSQSWLLRLLTFLELHRAGLRLP